VVIQADRFGQWNRQDRRHSEVQRVCVVQSALEQ